MKPITYVFGLILIGLVIVLVLTKKVYGYYSYYAYCHNDQQVTALGYEIRCAFSRMGQQLDPEQSKGLQSPEAIKACFCADLYDFAAQ